MNSELLRKLLVAGAAVAAIYQAQRVPTRTPQTEGEGSREVKKPEILKPEGGET